MKRERREQEGEVLKGSIGVPESRSGEKRRGVCEREGTTRSKRGSEKMEQCGREV